MLSILGYKDEEDAVRIANDTPYASRLTQAGDLSGARRVARRLRAVSCSSTTRGGRGAPFGGYKQSCNGQGMGK